jgi:G:T-mismatch repair DNA endonuclease (very short patch repair protein)
MGYDCNSLYLWALDQDLPTGIFVRRKKENNFKADIRDKYVQAFNWLDHLNSKSSHFIRHFRNTGYEKKILQYPVDGFCQDTQTVYQFHGCYFHGCNKPDCPIVKTIKDPEWHKQREEKYQKTKSIEQTIESQGYYLEVMWECEFRQYCRDNGDIYGIIRKTRPDFCRKRPGSVSESDICQAVRDGSLFGLVELDIRVLDKFPDLPKFRNRPKPL